SGVDRIYFPEKSNQVPDRPSLAFVVLAPERSMEDERKTLQFVEAVTREYGSSGRTFKSGLVWCVPDSASALYDEARKLLAWEDIQAEEDQLRLDDAQKRQLNENVRKAQRDLREAVWRTYKHLVLLGKDNVLQQKDLGLVHSSAAADLVSFLLNRLRGDGDVEPAVSPTFLARHWPAMKEWSTKAVRDAFFASPLFPRLLDGDSVKETIARGVENGVLAYVGKGRSGRYEPFLFGTSLSPDEVEIADEMFVLTAEEAKKHVEPPRLTTLAVSPSQTTVEPGKKQTFTAKGLDQHGQDIDAGQVAWSATGGTVGADGVFQAGPDEGSFLVTATAGSIRGTASVTVARPGVTPPLVKPPVKQEPTGLSWEGQVPAQKWMNFYTKVLSKFAGSKGLRLTVRFDLDGDGPISPQKIEETKVALRELGLDDRIEQR
ncbi:MAG TPA: Ig-like domain-containing protein, partial [Gemmataceae bacterium]|nr:Ig-like domain-containing protein [Gemmataceae bacterium]